MNPLRSTCLWALLLFIPPFSGLSQAPAGRYASPTIGYTYPAGGGQGRTVVVTVGGQTLGTVNQVDFFGTGLTGRIVSHHQPLNQKQFQDLNEESDRLREKRRLAGTTGAEGKVAPPWTEADERRVAEIRAQAGYRTNRQLAPAIAEAVSVEITIAPEAPVGPRELRLRSPAGLSNPLAFWVGSLPEFSETPAHPNTAPAVDRPGNQPERKAKLTPPRIVTLPATVNGQILPGEVDRIRFHALAGQHLVISTSARSLIPYIADAVPGWFQAALLLRDDQGREVAYNDDNRFNPDPTLTVVIPQEGDYVLEVKDAIYRGRQDFIYRIALGELPLITRLFPLGGSAGQLHVVQLEGWNLSSTRATLDGRQRGPGKLEFSCRNHGLPSNSVAFAFDRDPEILEVETAATATEPSALTLPVIVNGRIDQPGDVDLFGFEGQAQTTLVIEVVARRLNSPVDSLLQLLGPEGQVLASNDDSDDKGAGLLPHQADSRILYPLTRSGRYTVRLSDAQHQGGPDHGYRLHVRTARPDFELRVVPSAINLRAGTHHPVTVYALRKDGFVGPIELGLQGDQGSLAISGGLIPAGEDKVRLTLTTIASPGRDSFRLSMLGRAVGNDSLPVHIAVPCEDLMQAFAYRHLVPARELRVTMVGNAQAVRSPIRFLDRPPLRFTGTKPAHLRVSLPYARPGQSFSVELSEGPEGITLQDTVRRGDALDLVFAADPAKVKAGARGNLILRVTADGSGKAGAKGTNRGRPPAFTLPALPYEMTVIEKTVARSVVSGP